MPSRRRETASPTRFRGSVFSACRCLSLSHHDLVCRIWGKEVMANRLRKTHCYGDEIAVSPRKGEAIMHKKLAFVVAIACVLAFAGSAVGAIPPGTSCIISYDGMVKNDPAGTGAVLVDTLIVVTNSHPTAPMYVYIDVFDKYGTQVGTQQTLLNGGTPLSNNMIPGNGYGWITLGMILQAAGRITHDPWGFEDRAEKFSFRIYTNKAGNLIPPVVEVKQFIYTNLESPGEAAWNPSIWRSWTETSLGGKNGTGIVWSQ